MRYSSIKVNDYMSKAVNEVDEWLKSHVRLQIEMCGEINGYHAPLISVYDIMHQDRVGK